MSSQSSRSSSPSSTQQSPEDSIPCSWIPGNRRFLISFEPGLLPHKQILVGILRAFPTTPDLHYCVAFCPHHNHMDTRHFLVYVENAIETNARLDRMKVKIPAVSQYAFGKNIRPELLRYLARNDPFCLTNIPDLPDTDSGVKLPKYVINDPALLRMSMIKAVELGRISIMRAQAFEALKCRINNANRIHPILQNLIIRFDLFWSRDYSGPIEYHINLRSQKRGLWLYGTTGTGKTYTALKQAYATYRVPMKGMSWMDFQNEPILVCDNVDYSPVDLLKLLDGEIPGRPKKGIKLTKHVLMVVSFYRLSAAFPRLRSHNPDLKKLKSRFQEVEFKDVYPGVVLNPTPIVFGRDNNNQ